MPSPTPGGVPVVMTSPASSNMKLADVPDQVMHVEDHRPGVAVLADHTVHL